LFSIGRDEKCFETRNFAPLLGLIEEAQGMGNRMEAALWDQKDFKEMQEQHRKLKKEVEALRQEKKDLKPSQDD